MALSIQGKRVLLTGASGGIGNAIARALHERGAELVVTGRRGDALEALKTELRDRVEPVISDLADRDAVRTLAGSVGDVDIVVANAALPASGGWDSFSEAEIDHALDVNLRAPIQLTRMLAPPMVDRGSGHLVFISSIAGKIASGGASLYSATKFGLRGYAFSLGQDLQGTGVGVTCVFPGFIRDAGMFADSGLKPPSGVGTSAPQEVAAAVVSGIEKGRSEIDVAPLFVRASSKLNGLAPGLVAGLSRRMGADVFASDLADRQVDKR